MDTLAAIHKSLFQSMILVGIMSLSLGFSKTSNSFNLKEDSNKAKKHKRYRCKDLARKRFINWINHVSHIWLYRQRDKYDLAHFSTEEIVVLLAFMVKGE